MTRKSEKSFGTIEHGMMIKGKKKEQRMHKAEIQILFLEVIIRFEIRRTILPKRRTKYAFTISIQIRVTEWKYD